MCKLEKTLHGLRKSPQKWHEKIDQFLVEELGFCTARSDPCLYIRRDEDAMMSTALFLDDFLLADSIPESVK